MLRCLLPLLAWPGLAWPAEIAGHTMGHIRMDANLTVEEMTCELPRGCCCLCCLLPPRLLLPAAATPTPAAAAGAAVAGVSQKLQRPAACL